MTFAFVERRATIWPVRLQLFSVALPNQGWLADITYVPTAEG